MTGENIPEGITRELRGPLSLNPALNTTKSQALWGQQPDRPLTTRQDHDAFNVWFERNGGTVAQTDTGYDLTTDSTQTGSEAILETAQLGVYRPGVMAAVGGGFYIRQRPTGDGEIEIGYQMDADSDGFAHRITADDFLGVFENEASGHSFTVSRDAGEWDHDTVTEKTDGSGNTIARIHGIDPLDGEGPSSHTWDPGSGYIYGFQVGWYGPSCTLAYVKAVHDYNGNWTYGTIPLYMVEPVGDPLFESPNRPLQVRVDNGTTAEEVKARVLGRQFTLFGGIAKQFTPIWATAQDQTLPMDGTGAGDRDWYVVAVARRKTGGDYDGTAIGLQDFEIASASEPLELHARTVDPSFLTDVTYQSPVDIDPTQSPVELDMASDTPDRVSIDTYTTSDNATIPQGISYKGDIIGSASKNTAVEGDLSGDLKFPVVRNNPTVWLARTRTGQADDVDTNVQFEVIG